MGSETKAKPQEPIVFEPSAVAAKLGISVPALVALLRKYRYTFTELAVGGRPGDRGRHRWGLTEAQIQAVLRGQERGFVEPKSTELRSKASAVSPDGKSRLRRGLLSGS